MKHFVDPDQRPIEPPTAPVEDTPFLTVDDFPPDSFASSREERQTTRDSEPDSPTAGEQQGPTSNALLFPS